MSKNSIMDNREDYGLLGIKVYGTFINHPDGSRTEMVACPVGQEKLQPGVCREFIVSVTKESTTIYGTQEGELIGVPIRQHNLPSDFNQQ